MIVIDASLTVDALSDDGQAGETAHAALRAEARGCALVTADDKLLDCPGARCRVEVVGTRGRPG